LLSAPAPIHSGLKTGFNSVIVFAQCGQGIFCPVAWLGNSMCSLQKKQDIFMDSIVCGFNQSRISAA